MKSLKAWWVGLQESYYIGVNYEEDRWWFRWYLVFYYIVCGNWWVRQYCRVFGHKMDCNSDIGPDHGIEQHYCSRCGWSQRIVWY